MRKYLTWRCIGLHALVLALVPAFLLAGWWQYHVALGGNDLSWVYTVEWPFFAVYAVYIWWKLIHDESTPFDRLWTAKQRAAADAEGRPLHEIPGWATDKALSLEVHRASREAARHPSLSGARLEALDLQVRRPPSPLPTVPDRVEELESASTQSASIRDDDLVSHAGPAIDAQVLEIKVHVDEELDAYNRYLFDLSRNGSPKRWGPRKFGGHHDVPGGRQTPNPMPVRERPALPPTNEDH
jgi:hypothetical protein